MGVDGKGEGAWDAQAKTGNQEQSTAYFAYLPSKLLLLVTRAANEEAHSQAEQEVGQDRAQNSGYIQ